METYLSQAMFHFLCFKHHWYIFPAYFCIFLKSLRIDKNIKQDKIAQSSECLTKECDFSSCTGSNPVSDIMFLSLIFWTLFELCTRANINLWLIKWKNRRLWSQCVVTERCSRRARTHDVLMRPQRLSSRVVFPNREWSSNCGRTELEKRSFAGQRRAFLSISLEVP